MKISQECEDVSGVLVIWEAETEAALSPTPVSKESLERRFTDVCITTHNSSSCGETMEIMSWLGVITA